MHLNVYDVFQSKFSHQHVSATVASSSGRYYYKNTKVQMWLVVSSLYDKNYCNFGKNDISNINIG
jgi:hypothetical protein